MLDIQLTIEFIIEDPDTGELLVYPIDVMQDNETEYIKDLMIVEESTPEENAYYQIESIDSTLIFSYLFQDGIRSAFIESMFRLREQLIRLKDEGSERVGLAIQFKLDNEHYKIQEFIEIVDDLLDDEDSFENTIFYTNSSNPDVSDLAERYDNLYGLDNLPKVWLEDCVDLERLGENLDVNGFREQELVSRYASILSNLDMPYGDLEDLEDLASQDFDEVQKFIEEFIKNDKDLSEKYAEEEIEDLFSELEEAYNYIMDLSDTELAEYFIDDVCGGIQYLHDYGYDIKDYIDFKQIGGKLEEDYTFYHVGEDVAGWVANEY